MAPRITDRQKKKIVADYLSTESYSAAAKLNGVSRNTAKKVVLETSDIDAICQKKKDENTADIIAYMESQREAVCKIIETGLRVLPEKIENAKTATEVTTALGTLIDKWTGKEGAALRDTGDDDPITKAMREAFDRGSKL